MILLHYIMAAFAIFVLSMVLSGMAEDVDMCEEEQTEINDDVFELFRRESSCAVRDVTMQTCSCTITVDPDPGTVGIKFERKSKICNNCYRDEYNATLQSSNDANEPYKILRNGTLDSYETFENVYKLQLDFTTYSSCTYLYQLIFYVYNPPLSYPRFEFTTVTCSAPIRFTTTKTTTTRTTTKMTTTFKTATSFPSTRSPNVTLSEAALDNMNYDDSPNTGMIVGIVVGVVGGAVVIIFAILFVIFIHRRKRNLSHGTDQTSSPKQNHNTPVDGSYGVTPEFTETTAYDNSAVTGEANNRHDYESLSSDAVETKASPILPSHDYYNHDFHKANATINKSPVDLDRNESTSVDYYNGSFGLKPKPNEITETTLVDNELYEK